MREIETEKQTLHIQISYTDIHQKPQDQLKRTIKYTLEEKLVFSWGSLWQNNLSRQ